MAASKPYDEKHALELLAKGSQYAFMQIYDRYRPRIYRSAIRVLRSPELAQEIVQEVFLKLWLKRDEMKHVLNFNAFISTMGRNLIFDYLKNNAEELEANREYAHTLEHDNSTEKFMLEQQYAELLKNAVDQLPPQQKIIFRLAKMEGLSHEAIAEQLNLSRLTVKTHMKQALHTIRLKLQPHIAPMAVIPIIFEVFNQ